MGRDPGWDQAGTAPCRAHPRPANLINASTRGSTHGIDYPRRVPQRPRAVHPLGHDAPCGSTPPGRHDPRHILTQPALGPSSLPQARHGLWAQGNRRGRRRWPRTPGPEASPDARAACGAPKQRRGVAGRLPHPATACSTPLASLRPGGHPTGPAGRRPAPTHGGSAGAGAGRRSDPVCNRSNGRHDLEPRPARGLPRPRSPQGSTGRYCTPPASRAQPV